MQCFFLWRLAVFLFEKPQLLDMTMTLLALGDDLAIEYVECGK